MSQETEKPTTDINFWDKANWDIIKGNKIDRDTFLKIKSKNQKAYCTLLGEQDDMKFFMFKPLMWSDYKEIKTNNLDKNTSHEYILSSCLLWPKTDPIFINSLEAGIMTTLVYQILSVSLFLNDPLKALDMIIEV